jgi:hypothetical protein
MQNLGEISLDKFEIIQNYRLAIDPLELNMGG